MQLHVMQKNFTILRKTNTDNKNLIVCIVFCFFFNVSHLQNGGRTSRRQSHGDTQRPFFASPSRPWVWRSTSPGVTRGNHKEITGEGQNGVTQRYRYNTTGGKQREFGG